MKLSRNKIFKLLNKKNQTHKKYKINNKKYNNRSFRNKKKNLNLRKKTLKYNRKKKYNLKGGRKGRYQSGGAGEWWKKLFGATKAVKENIKDPVQKENIENVETILQEWNSLLEPIDKLDKAINQLETRKETLMNSGKLTTNEEERLNTMINNQLQIQSSLIKRQTIILNKLNALTNNINLEQQENINRDDISELNNLGQLLSNNDNVDGNGKLIELNQLSDKMTEEDKIDDDDIDKSNKLSKTLSSETSKDNNTVEIELQELEEKQKKLSNKDLLNNTDPNKIAKELVSALRRVSSNEPKVEIELTNLGKKPDEEDPQKKTEQLENELRRVSKFESNSKPEPAPEPAPEPNSKKTEEIVIDEQKTCNNSINWNDGKQYTINNSDKQLYLCTDKDKFQITDVYGDGNCGYYAIIKGIQEKRTEIDNLTPVTSAGTNTKNLYNPILDYKQQNNEGEQIKYTTAAVNGIKNLINSKPEDIGLLTDDYLKSLALKLEIPILYTTSPKSDDTDNYLWTLYPAREYTKDELRKQMGIVSSNNFREDSLLSPLLLYHRPAKNAELIQEREKKFSEEITRRINNGESKDAVDKAINIKRNQLTSVDHWQVISPKSNDNKVYIVYPPNQESERNSNGNNNNNDRNDDDDDDDDEKVSFNKNKDNDDDEEVSLNKNKDNDEEVSLNKNKDNDEISLSKNKDKILSPSDTIENAFTEGYPNLTQKLSGNSPIIADANTDANADANADSGINNTNIKNIPSENRNTSNISSDTIYSKGDEMIQLGSKIIEEGRELMEKANQEKINQDTETEDETEDETDNKSISQGLEGDTEFNVKLQFNKEGIAIENDGPGGGNTAGAFYAFNKNLNSQSNNNSNPKKQNNSLKKYKNVFVVDDEDTDDEEQYGGNRKKNTNKKIKKTKNKTIKKMYLTFNL